MKNFIKANTVLLISFILVFSTSAVIADNKEAIEISSITKNIISNINKPKILQTNALFEDSFEAYEDFSIDFQPWTNIDVDGELTWGHSAFNFTHENEAYAFLIFNPLACDPPQEDPELLAHTGDKYTVCWAVQNTLQNDDWLITPQLEPNNFGTVSFWAKSYSDQYNIERIEVGVSTTDTDPTSFTIISSAPYIEPPTEWTKYSYNLDSYDDQSIYIGIHCVSYDSWFLMVDDFMVSEGDSAICCDGSLSWEDVPPGTTVSDTFEICNCGDNGTILNWQFESAPNWPGAVFEIEPDSGQGLQEGECVTITVNVTAPTNKTEEFIGKIKIINSDDTSNFCEIDVYLKTPRSKITYNSLIQRLIEKFPKLNHIIGYFIGK
ncbi:MAG: hypothetical protein AYK22_00180 [Thermoplasmatales archaeon SG8-52-3]|nr:MAG: hypothetical protein AYK22_00180 [Thermoplasmatales archaeon SG8-52-3]